MLEEGIQKYARLPQSGRATWTPPDLNSDPTNTNRKQRTNLGFLIFLSRSIELKLRYLGCDQLGGFIRVCGLLGLRLLGGAGRSSMVVCHSTSFMMLTVTESRITVGTRASSIHGWRKSTTCRRRSLQRSRGWHPVRGTSCSMIACALKSVWRAGNTHSNI